MTTGQDGSILKPMSNTNHVDPTSATARALRLATTREVAGTTRYESTNSFVAEINRSGLFEKVDGYWLLTDKGEAARAELLAA